MADVFSPINASEKPANSRFFLGETVLHLGDQQMYTVCSLSHYQQDYYFLWPLGWACAIPTHGAYGPRLEAVGGVVEETRCLGVRPTQ